MDGIKVCRICLVTDVKMYYLQTQPLEYYFELLTGNPVTEMMIPPFVCFECAALLKKYNNFRLKCLRGQSILNGILQSSGQITKQQVHQIKNINRTSFQLVSNFVVHKIPKNNIIHYVYDETNDFDIKTEFIIEDELNNDIKQEFNNDDYLQLLPEDDYELSSQDESNNKYKTTINNHIKLYIKSDVKDSHDIKDAGKKAGIPVKAPKTIPKKLPTNPIRPEFRNINNQHTKLNIKKKTTIKTEYTSSDQLITVIPLTLEQQIEEVNKRQHSHYYINSAFQCKICYRGFLSLESWQHHNQKHDPITGNVECPVCKYRFKQKYRMTQHSHLHEKKYQCNICEHVSRTLDQARRHQCIHRGVTYVCEHCNEIFKTSYLSHLRVKHPSNYLCNICGYSFLSNHGLSGHKIMMHKDLKESSKSVVDIDPKLYCKECDVQFMSAEAYKRHLVTSAKHREPNFSNGCRDCGETFKSSEEFILHRRLHTTKYPKNYARPLGKWPATCAYCPLEIKSAKENWIHCRREHSDKPYPIEKKVVCDVCGKTFQSKALMVYHYRIHSGEKPYKCSICEKAFRKKEALNVHEKSHSDERPFPCPECHKAFKFKGALDRHSRSHSGIKPYKCEICGKSFNQSNSRKVHINTVHFKQPVPYVSRKRLLKKTKTESRPFEEKREEES